MDTEKILKEILNVVIDEMKINKDFENRINIALGKESEPKKKKRVRQPALFNPNTIALKGEDVLKEELEKLDVSQLKDIIAQYAMDPAKSTSRWKKKEKFIDYILEIVDSRLKRGDVFK